MLLTMLSECSPRVTVSKMHSRMNYSTWLKGMNWVNLLWWQNGFKCMPFSFSKRLHRIWCVGYDLHSYPAGSFVHLVACCVYSPQSFLSGALAVLCIRHSWGKSSKCCLRFSNDRQLAISINPLSVFSKELFDKGVCRTGSAWQDSAPTQIPPLQMKETETLHHHPQHWCRQPALGGNPSTGVCGGGRSPASAQKATQELCRFGEQ